eukprot:681087-Pleurochrysis_carterae.AAC.1
MSPRRGPRLPHGGGGQSERRSPRSAQRLSTFNYRSLERKAEQRREALIGQAQIRQAQFIVPSLGAVVIELRRQAAVTLPRGSLDAPELHGSGVPISTPREGTRCSSLSAPSPRLPNGPPHGASTLTATEGTLLHHYGSSRKCSLPNLWYVCHANIDAHSDRAQLV